MEEQRPLNDEEKAALADQHFQLFKEQNVGEMLLERLRLTKLIDRLPTGVPSKSCTVFSTPEELNRWLFERLIWLRVNRVLLWRIIGNPTEADFSGLEHPWAIAPNGVRYVFKSVIWREQMLWIEVERHHGELTSEEILPVTALLSQVGFISERGKLHPGRSLRRFWRRTFSHVLISSSP